MTRHQRRPEKRIPAKGIPRQGRGLAAAVGGWSARHRKTAVFGWLLFVVLATVLGGMAGSLQTTDQDNGIGQSGRADQMIDRAGINSPATETVLIQAKGFTATDPRFHAAVDDAVNAVKSTGAASAVKSPYSDGAIAPNGHSALVTVTMAGDPDTADDRVAPVLAAVAGVQAKHPDLTVQEFGDASADKWFNDAFTHDFSRAEWTAVPLALGILLIAFGALVAAVLPVLLASDWPSASTTASSTCAVSGRNGPRAAPPRPRSPSPPPPPDGPSWSRASPWSSPWPGCSSPGSPTSRPWAWPPSWS